MAAAAFCAIWFAQRAGWPSLAWRWGCNNKPHAQPACGCARRALSEEAFASACVRCGQCVQACPYDTLKLATLASGLAAGTPYFIARDIPCEMCEDIPCAKVCPSGALDREIESIDDSRMGLAVLLDHENCLNYQGLRCDVCYRECPKIDEAITPSWTVTCVPASMRGLFLPCTAMPVPAVGNAKKSAYWSSQQ